MVRQFFAAVAMGTAIALLSSQCGMESDEEECCECLVAGNCTATSRSDCGNVLFEGGSFSIDIDCVRQNGCYSPCALAGAYFDSTDGSSGWLKQPRQNDNR